MILVNMAEAATPGTVPAEQFVEKLNDVILFPLIILLTGVALLVFFYGCFIYIAKAENSSAREEGKRHILYGVIGLLVMLTALSLLSIAANTFGLKEELGCADNPSAPGCFPVDYEMPCSDPDRPPGTPC